MADSTLQKLVLSYSTFDGAWSHNYFLAFEHSSKEEAEMEFEDLATDAQRRQIGFEFKGQQFNPGEYFHNREYLPPRFETLEEWFESEKYKEQ